MAKFEVSINEPFPFPVTVVVEAKDRRDAKNKGYGELCELVGVPVNPSRLKVRKEKALTRTLADLRRAG